MIFFISNFSLALLLLLLKQNGVRSDIQGIMDPADCPGTCTTVIDCKSIGATPIGFCLDGKMCCGGVFNAIVSSGSCGATVSNRKLSRFHSPNYPMPDGGSLICEFTLQLSPSTVGIRVDFLDVNLPTVPTNPTNFYESANPVCDSDFMMFRGFPGWSPDFRCGNLTGYSLMVERETNQAVLSIVFIMASMQYRWNILLTQIYSNEIDALDYSLRNPGQDKKPMIWYSQPQPGIPLQLSPPMAPPQLYPSGGGLPPWQFYQPLKRAMGIPDDASESFDTNKTLDNTPVSRIVGGAAATPNGIPWQVSIQLVDKVPSTACGETRNISGHFCGGTILDERTILTAAHCFFSSSKNSHPLLPVTGVKVVVGEHDFCTGSEVSSTQEYFIQRVNLHYNYLATDVLNDVAVVTVRNPIAFSQYVHPIKLADEQTQVEGLKPLLSGWGSLGVEENSTYPTILQQSSNIEIFPEKECERFQREFLEYVIPDSRLSGKYRGAFSRGICTKASDGVTEAGFGDSGGPLAGIPDDPIGQPVLLGVVSHMRPHPDTVTGIDFHLNYFGKVSAYRKWILMTMVK